MVSPPCTAAGWFHHVRLCLTAELKRRRKPSATRGSGPARCGGAARRGHMVSTCPRPPQKGPPRSGSAARGGTTEQKEEEQEGRN